MTSKPELRVEFNPFDPLSHPSYTRRRGLGNLQALNDRIIVKILRYLSAQELLSLSLVSHAFHQFANWDELWRRLCHDQWEGDFEYKHSWKITTFFPRSDRINPKLLTPIRIDGFYSEYMYSRWLRGQTDYGNFTADTGHVPRLNPVGYGGELDMSLEDFRRYYDRLYPLHGRPVILTGLINAWPAWTNQSWTPDALTQRFKHTIFKCTEFNRYGKRVWMTMADFVTYMRRQHDDKPIYLFDDGFAERAPELLKDYSIPEYFVEDFFACMDHRRPPWRWLVVGPQRSATPFHVDPRGTSAWNALLYGRKRWTLYPPHITPPGLRVMTDWKGYVEDTSALYPTKWFAYVYPNLKEDMKPIEFVQEAGEMVFIPGGWWHQVLNLTETVSVTQNFVNESNFLWIIEALVQHDEWDFLSFFKERILPLRPDLYKKMTHHIDFLKGKYAKEKLTQKKKEWKVQKAREKEREEEWQKQREVWQQKEMDLRKQIADLQAQLDLARHRTVLNSDVAALPSSNPLSTHTPESGANESCDGSPQLTTPQNSTLS